MKNQNYKSFQNCRDSSKDRVRHTFYCTRELQHWVQNNGNGQAIEKLLLIIKEKFKDNHKAIENASLMFNDEFALEISNLIMTFKQKWK